MSHSRKRFRPLDPAEERDIKSGQRLGLEVLEDELSYYFSWPDAPLTVLLASVPDYVQQHIYHKNIVNVHGNGSKANYSSGISLTSSDRAGAASLNGASRQASMSPSMVHLTLLPTVYDLKDDRVLESTTKSANDDDMGEFLQDMKPILQRAMLAENYSNATSIMMNTGSSSNLLKLTCPPETKKLRDGYRATFSSPPKSATYEDSIFSLHAEQLSDAKAAGLISYSVKNMTKVKEEQIYDHPDHVVVVSANDSNSAMGIAQPKQEDDLFTTFTDSVPCLQRHHVENEIVALEWRAFHQSKRTAAALRRLLSLEAAVPFEALTNGVNEAPAQVSDGDNDSQKCRSACECDSNVWRDKVYRLWLHWRLCSSPRGPVLAAHTQYQNHQSAPFQSVLPNTNCSSQETNFLTCFNTRYPWGPSLLVSAYLYDTQGDYFIDPQQSGLATAPSLSSILSSSPASLTTSFAIPRRRGIYNFLRWRVELYMARSIQSRGSIAASATSLHSVQHECATQLLADHELPQGRRQTHGGNAIEADTASEFDKNNRSGSHFSQSIQLQNMLLGSSEIDFLVNREVLASPLVEVQQDMQQNRLDVLECRDLKQDVEIWRGWLSKV